MTTTRQVTTEVVTARVVVAEMRNMMICWYFTAWEILAPPRIAPVIIPGMETRPITLSSALAQVEWGRGGLVFFWRGVGDLIWFIVGRRARRRPGFSRSCFPISHRLAPKLKNNSICAEFELPSVPLSQTIQTYYGKVVVGGVDTRLDRGRDLSQGQHPK
jgi:hypothetical protein